MSRPVEWHEASLDDVERVRIGTDRVAIDDVPARSDVEHVSRPVPYVWGESDAWDEAYRLAGQGGAGA